MHKKPHIAVIGAGIGGLASALRLAHAGARVTVLERHNHTGGKMRTLPSASGPIDAGPTVLTMKHVFDQLFTDVGARLEDHVVLRSEPLLARHFWTDGTRLDLMASHEQSAQNIAHAFNTKAAREYEAFCMRTRVLFDAFDVPMMQAGKPGLAGLTRTVLRKPTLLAAMAPHRNLDSMLRQQFSEPKLAQLFARYATYVGGTPDTAPALLCLIWEAERRGVWHVQGGMHRLAYAIECLARTRGVDFRLGTQVTRIETTSGQVTAIHTPTERIRVDAAIFNGDPHALSLGLLGPEIMRAVPKSATAPRSLSAQVLAFAATPNSDLPLGAHNVFFADEPRGEYTPLNSGRMQTDPTLYLCAQDRFGGAQPTGAERFEIILNAPPALNSSAIPPQEILKWHRLIFDRLARFGLEFAPPPDINGLTGPKDFDALFPGSKGSLYGRSPAGMTAALARPTARTTVAGLYLAGGGAHPGAGVPMATLSAAHAAEAMIHDLCLTSTCLQAATRGGM